jgi:hypothetical protein
VAKQMTFRIIKYYDRYKAQILKNRFNGRWLEEDWVDIGSTTGYTTVEDAKQWCKYYKASLDAKVVEIFEL